MKKNILFVLMIYILSGCEKTNSDFKNEKNKSDKIDSVKTDLKKREY